MYDKVVLDGNPKIKIKSSSEMEIKFESPSEVGIYTKVVEAQYPAYTGETTVTPKAFEEQVLETALKTVYSDITVKEIPYTEVSNLSGGTTVSIG